jgi:hypothetical protein
MLSERNNTRRERVFTRHRLLSENFAANPGFVNVCSEKNIWPRTLMPPCLTSNGDLLSLQNYTVHQCNHR